VCESIRALAAKKLAAHTVMSLAEFVNKNSVARKPVVVKVSYKEEYEKFGIE